MTMTWLEILDLLHEYYEGKPDDFVLNTGHWQDDEVTGLPRFNPLIRLTMEELRTMYREAHNLSSRSKAMTERAEKQNLHLYILSEDGQGDGVIAFSREDAIDLWEAMSGQPIDLNDYRIRQVPPSEIVAVKQIDEDGQPWRKMTAAEWVATYGRGHVFGWGY